MRRRTFLGRASGMGAALALGPAFWQRVLAAPAAPVQPGDSPYGPLRAPDANGMQLPEGFTSRVIAEAPLPVPGTSYLWHAFPDGGACVPTDDGGWIYVSNSENPPPVDLPLVPEFGLGKASAIRFSGDGSIADAYAILTGSTSNCAGGLTPWGTWLSCEEWEAQVDPFDAGKVWECDPFGGPAVDRPALGRFKHEMAAVDPVRHHVYLSEDQSDGLLYRYTPPPGVWGSGDALVGGTLEAMAVADDGSVTWLPVPGDPGAPTGPLRDSVAGATRFNGGEGLVYDSDHVYLATKGDDRVWVLDLEAATMIVLYDAKEFGAPVLDGVDNIIVSAAHDLYVAEDGGNMEVCIITPDLAVAPVLRMTGAQHGIDTGTPIPLISEVTGLAFSPDGNRLYFASQRGSFLPVGPGLGVLYEVTGPFRGGTLAAEPAEPPVEAPTTTSTTAAPPATAPPAGSGRLPATGVDSVTGAAGVAATAAAALWWLRQRARVPSDPTQNGGDPGA